ncbi:MAG: hypothetical protein ACJA1Q_001481, partial [Pseudohongiellaceae bacterium]
DIRNRPFRLQKEPAQEIADAARSPVIQSMMLECCTKSQKEAWLKC